MVLHIAKPGSVLVVAVLALSACSTPYQDMGIFGGVKVTPIDSTTLQISARGNAFTDKSKIEDYVLLKAAEETNNRGYGFFKIVQDEDASRSETYTIPETHYATGFGVTATGQPISTSYSYTTNRTSSYFKPGEITLVKMFNGVQSPSDSPGTFSAREVINNLGPQIEGSSAQLAVPVPTPAPPAQPAEAMATPPPPICQTDADLERLAREQGFRYISPCKQN